MQQLKLGTLIDGIQYKIELFYFKFIKKKKLLSYIIELPLIYLQQLIIIIR